MRLYPRLAVNGIKNNSRIYYPYIGTCIGIIAIYYLVSALHSDSIIRDMKGGSVLCELMFYSRFIFGFFSVLFLFFTSAFIGKRRTAEFGLYNVLGMNKRNISMIILIENLIVYAFSVVCGIAIGIGMTKFAEAGIGKILDSSSGNGLYVPAASVVETLVLFAAVFGLVTLNSLRHITFTGAAQLVKNEQLGEKPPRGNVIIAAVGLVMLIAAYILASDVSGLRGMIHFAIAVMMVIVSTYLLFIAGFTAVCTLMKRSKRYYYNKKHFVSVSSMIFRMKRGGAGLGTICILTTMVLVIMSSTTCLYGGIDRTIEMNYPREYELDVIPHDNSSSEISSLRSKIHELSDDLTANGRISDPIILSTAYPSLFLDHGELKSISLSDEGEMALIMDHLNDLVNLIVIPVEEASVVMGTDLKIDEGEALVWVSDDDIDLDMLSVGEMDGFFCGIDRFTAVNIDDPDKIFYESSSALAHRMIMIVNDFDEVAAGFPDMATIRFYYDSPFADKVFDEDIRDVMRSEATMNYYEKDYVRDEVYGVYGGLLFMGIMLCIIFLGATVLLMYYRQVVEGYEDLNRFRILRKIGMEKKSISASINSQILVVFVSPVLLAVLHTIMATPFLMFFMKLQGMWFTDQYIKTLIATFAIFLIVYYMVYKLTSRVYTKIIMK